MPLHRTADAAMTTAGEPAASRLRAARCRLRRDDYGRAPLLAEGEAFVIRRRGNDCERRQGVDAPARTGPPPYTGAACFRGTRNLWDPQITIYTSIM